MYCQNLSVFFWYSRSHLASLILRELVNLFAFGFYPTSRGADASRLRRISWKLKTIKRRVIHHHNFGDYLSYLLVSRLSAGRVSLAEQGEQGKFLAIGSILWALQDHDVIWGSGAHRADQIPFRQGVSCHAVRGPLTLQELKKAGVVVPESEPLFFDPAVLVPLLYPHLSGLPRVEGRTLVIPHYSDITRVNAMRKSSGISLTIANPFTHPLTIAEMIARSGRVISSSLHGLILADALGTPAVPMRLEGNQEPLFKYEDYYEGSGRRLPQFSKDLRSALDAQPLVFAYSRELLVRCLASFPYPLKDRFTGLAATHSLLD